MKKANLTFLKKQASRIFLGSMFLLAGTLGVYGQCSLACNGSTNVSLDNTMCQAVITVDMVADVSGCTAGDFTVTVNDANGVAIPNATVTAAYVGQTLEVVVTDNITNNSCWGDLLVEDKLPPVMDCTQASSDIFCFDLDTFEPTATDNCDSDPEIILLNEVVTVNDCNDSTIPENVLKTVTRTYVAEDNQGLRSNECVFTFNVLRLDDLSAIDEPNNFLLVDDTNLQCDGVYHKLSNGHPSPTDTVVGGVVIPGTGVPEIDDNDLYPNAYQDCNILVTFDDTELPPIGCAIKIMRTWTILEWSCSSPQRSYEFVQMLEIVDSEGPTIVCPSDMTFSTNGSSCESTMILPAAEVSDNCSDNVTVDIAYQGGFINDTNGGLAQLPVGVNTVTYTAYDDCLNSSSCEITVTVEDQTPPVVICDQFTAVSLTSDGCAYVNASVFDDGSFDECSDVTLSVRRMDGNGPCADDAVSCNTENDVLFDEYVRFCCADDVVTVVLRATDANGNVNDCMVQVEVQDKLAPTVVCPADMTVTCDFAYDDTNLSAFFGEAIVFDNCGNVQPADEINTDDLNQCNIGVAIRTISVGTPGTTNFSTCTQRITFEALEDFNYDGNDITWPVDVTLDGCEDPTGNAYLPQNLPANAQFPTYIEGACDLVGANYDDQIFPFNNPNGDACFKIVRTWTVIDWCQFTTQNGSTTYPQWTWVQVIKVNDNVGPTEIVTTGEASVCTFDAECADGSIELGASSSDECTDLLDWSYQILTDGDDDGKLDDILVINGQPQAFAGNSSNTIDASGTYPIGTHKVVYSFSDKCGNLVSKEFEFSIVNCKAPTAYCHAGLAVDLMNDGNGGGTVLMWATDLDAGSSHPCGYTTYVSFDPIEVSATGNVDAGNGILINVNNSREFTCADLGDNDVDVWAGVVTPEGDVIQSFCTATLNVQDNQMICPPGVGLIVEGRVATLSDQNLENASVSLMGSELQSEMTNIEGVYAFPAMPQGGAYSVAPHKNDDYTNGVSTLDLVMIQRQILGLQDLDSPYKHIAADINNDESLTATDLLQLRKLILGTITELPDNESWRFIDADFEFADATQPLDEPLPETYDISTLSSDMVVDFVAVKVGDVNDNAIANLKSDVASTRTNRSIEFAVANQAFTAANTVTVPVMISDDITTTGLQFTIEVADNMRFAGIASDMINIQDHNVGFSAMEQGVVTISWNNANGVELLAGDKIMDITFEAIAGGSLASDLEITSTMLAAEMYDENLETSAIEFTIEGREATFGEFVLYQNTPNPFVESTDITFDLPTAQAGTLTVFDVTGKVVKRIAKTFDQGANRITINRSELGASGVLYYQLEAGAYNASNKMIMID